MGGSATESEPRREVARCAPHDVETRLTCARCGEPICPRCLVRTDVGLRCERCAAPPASKGQKRPRRTIFASLAILLGVAAVVAAAALAGIFGDDEAPREQPAARGTWQRESPLVELRGSAFALSLPDGRVVVFGGGRGSVPASATEIFDPNRSQWTFAGSLNQARRGHRAAPLEQGRILTAGGIAGGKLLASAELFDPTSRKWQTLKKMETSRLGHTLTGLKDGSVLAAGGTGPVALAKRATQTVRPVADAEIYSPTNSAWRSVQDMSAPRFEHTATPLGNGRILIAGGLTTESGHAVPTDTAELYDPNTRRFVKTASMARARTDHAAVRLRDGRVLVVGGDADGSALADAEVFDPARDTWTQIAPLHQARRGHTATILKDGTVLVTGGELLAEGARRSTTAAERFDPSANSWAPAGNMACPRSDHAAAPLKDGSVLIAAGDFASPGRTPRPQGCIDRYIP